MNLPLIPAHDALKLEGPISPEGYASHVIIMAGWMTRSGAIYGYAYVVVWWECHLDVSVINARHKILALTVKSYFNNIIYLTER